MKVLLIGLLLLTSCKFTWREPGWREVDRRKSSLSEKIPVELWDLIEKEFAQEGVAKTSTNVQRPLKYMKLKVHLKEIHPGVLGGENVSVVYGMGGGPLDFSEFVGDGEGLFEIKVETEPVWNSGEFRVFYWPNSKKRNIDGKVFGSGCKSQILELTSIFKQKILKEGMPLTLHRYKYITLMAGIYIFVVNQDKALYLSHLKVSDSRYPVLQCRS